MLAGIGLVAGWINTVAGAGSLLLLPALMFTGLDASAANATNRLGVLATTSAAIVGYWRAGLRVGRAEVVLTAAAMVGGSVGALVAARLSPEHMQLAIVLAMGVMTVLSLVPTKKPSARTPSGDSPPRADAPSSAARDGAAEPTSRADAPSSAARDGAAEPTSVAAALVLPRPTLTMVLAFVGIGVYGGFLQAGLGIVVLLYLSLAHGVSLVASNVVKSTVTLALTLVAIAVFAAEGEHIDLARGGVLAASSALGGLVGARSTVALGDRFVRGIVVVAVLASMAKLLFDLL